MGQKLPPGITAGVIAIIVAIVAFFGYRVAIGPAGSQAGRKPPGMPPDVAAEFLKRAGGMTGPGMASRGAAMPMAPGPGGGAPTGPGPGMAYPMAPGSR